MRYASRFLQKCSDHIIDYLEYDVVTSIVKGYEIPSAFPAITICNSNPFTSREAQKLYESLAQISDKTLENANERDLMLISELARMNVSASSLTEKQKMGFSRDEIDFCQWELIYVD
jgi:hypothetical protein